MADKFISEALEIYLTLEQYNDLKNSGGLLPDATYYITDEEINYVLASDYEAKIATLQPKEDASLVTLSKEVVGAINEVKKAVDVIAESGSGGGEGASFTNQLTDLNYNKTQDVINKELYEKSGTKINVNGIFKEEINVDSDIQLQLDTLDANINVVQENVESVGQRQTNFETTTNTLIAEVQSDLLAKDLEITALDTRVSANEKVIEEIGSDIDSIDEDIEGLVSDIATIKTEVTEKIDTLETQVSEKISSVETQVSGKENTITTLATSKGGTGNTSVDTTPTSGSTKMCTSGGIYNAISSLGKYKFTGTGTDLATFTSALSSAVTYGKNNSYTTMEVILNIKHSSTSYSTTLFGKTWLNFSTSYTRFQISGALGSGLSGFSGYLMYNITSTGTATHQLNWSYQMSDNSYTTNVVSTYMGYGFNYIITLEK